VAGQAHAQGGTPLAPELSRGFLGTARVLQFDVFDGPGWPAPTELRRYFLAPPGRR